MNNNLNLQKAYISQATVKNLIFTGTITFYDENGKPTTTTISDIINRIYKAIASKQDK